MNKGNNRFEICQLVSKGVRITHKHGTRLEDSIGEVLRHLGLQPDVLSKTAHEIAMLRTAATRSVA